MNTEYRDRHIGPSFDDRDRMLAELGYSSIDALMDDALPTSVRAAIELALPSAISESELAAELAELGSRNEQRVPMQGWATTAASRQPSSDAMF